MSSNGEVTVGLLTVFEDCRLYRVQDGLQRVYVARCGLDVQTKWQVGRSCGKGCTAYDDFLALTAQEQPQ